HPSLHFTRVDKGSHQQPAAPTFPPTLQLQPGARSSSDPADLWAEEENIVMFRIPRLNFGILDSKDFLFGNVVRITSPHWDTVFRGITVPFIQSIKIDRQGRESVRDKGTGQL
ncbi:hypothetical protein AOLI_G00048730, partial [Acnodon oligacanthus]